MYNVIENKINNSFFLTSTLRFRIPYLSFHGIRMSFGCRGGAYFRRRFGGHIIKTHHEAALSESSFPFSSKPK